MGGGGGGRDDGILGNRVRVCVCGWVGGGEGGGRWLKQLWRESK